MMQRWTWLLVAALGCGGPAAPAEPHGEEHGAEHGEEHGEEHGDEHLHDGLPAGARRAARRPRVAAGPHGLGEEPT
jgi:hypothetical protein